MAAPEITNLDPASNEPPRRRRTSPFVRPLVPILLVAVIVCVWFAGTAFDRSRTAVRRFKAFVNASRDANSYPDVEYKQFLSCGEDVVVPVVVDALEGGDVVPRYQPQPVDILRGFPQAAQREMRRRLRDGITPSGDKRFSEMRNRGIDLERRSCLVYGLIAVANDWSYLDQWLTEAKLSEREEWRNGMSAYAMNQEVGGRLEEFGAPRLLLMTSHWDWHLNSEFVSWWAENRDHILHPEE
jgi:hypothetical protein